MLSCVSILLKLSLIVILYLVYPFTISHRKNTQNRFNILSGLKTGYSLISYYLITRSAPIWRKSFMKSQSKSIGPVAIMASFNSSIIYSINTTNKTQICQNYLQADFLLIIYKNQATTSPRYKFTGEFFLVSRNTFISMKAPIQFKRILFNGKVFDSFRILSIFVIQSQSFILVIDWQSDKLVLILLMSYDALTCLTRLISYLQLVTGLPLFLIATGCDILTAAYFKIEIPQNVYFFYESAKKNSSNTIFRMNIQIVDRYESLSNISSKWKLIIIIQKHFQTIQHPKNNPKNRTSTNTKYKAMEYNLSRFDYQYHFQIHCLKSDKFLQRNNIDKILLLKT